MKPITDAIEQMVRQQVLTSDVFKKYQLAIPNLNVIASEMMKGVDFSGFTEAFAAQQKALWEQLAPALEALGNFRYPANLRPVERITPERVQAVALVDGIALYGVPRTAIAQALIDADGAEDRRAILEDRWPEISVDCRLLVETIEHEPLLDCARLAVAATVALDEGHHEAAQALAASVVDAILRAHVPDYKKLLPKKNGVVPDRFAELGSHHLIAYAPLLHAYQRYTPGDPSMPIPEVFSRHATAHTAAPVQFTRCNAIQGVMFGCSLLHLLDVWAIAEAA